MQVTETSIEDEGNGGADLLSERARELDDVVSRKGPMFYKRAFRYLGSVPDAEDAVQDALLSAYKHLSQFRGEAQMSSWLTAIVINVARAQLRRGRGIHLSLEEQQGETVSHSQNGYLIPGRVRNKCVARAKHRAACSRSLTSSRQRSVEHFNCAISSV